MKRHFADFGYLAIVTTFLLLGCNETSLNGTSGTSKTRPKGNQDGIGKTDPVDDPEEDVDDGVEKDSKDEQETDTDAGSKETEEPEEPVLELEDAEKCRTKKEGRVNVVMIFDNSGSQNDSDLRSMRAGATALANTVSAEAKKEKAPLMALSVVKFSSNAAIGPNAWVETSDASFDSKITGDINWATADDGGDTYYAKAFAKAQELLGQRSTSASEKYHRNFIVFLTDGEPENNSDRTQALATATELVNTKGVALFPVGTGDGLDGDALSTLQQFALPKTGEVSPEHKGQLLQAETQQQITSIFSDIVKNLLVDPCKE